MATASHVPCTWARLRSQWTTLRITKRGSPVALWRFVAKAVAWAVVLWQGLWRCGVLWQRLWHGRLFCGKGCGAVAFCGKGCGIGGCFVAGAPARKPLCLLAVAFCGKGCGMGFVAATCGAVAFCGKGCGTVAFCGKGCGAVARAVARAVAWALWLTQPAVLGIAESPFCSIGRAGPRIFYCGRLARWVHRIWFSWALLAHFQHAVGSEPTHKKPKSAHYGVAKRLQKTHSATSCARVAFFIRMLWGWFGATAKTSPALLMQTPATWIAICGERSIASLSPPLLVMLSRNLPCPLTVARLSKSSLNKKTLP